MISFIISILMVLIVPLKTHALVVSSTLLVHPQSKKRALLLADWHDSYIRQYVADKEVLQKHEQLYESQKQDLSKRVQALLSLTKEQGRCTAIITETGDNMFSCVAEQEFGAAPVIDKGDSLEIIPRALLKQVVAAGSTVDQKVALFKKSLQSFKNIPSVSFTMKNGMLWIAGDRSRTQDDHCITFAMYAQWKQLVDALQKKEPISPEIEKYTLAGLKNYIQDIHNDLHKHNIADSYAVELIAALDEGLKVGNLSEADHIASFYGYLHAQGQKRLDAFANAMLCFISQKFDVELSVYHDAFKKDKVLNALLVHAGGDHIQKMESLLRAQGYTVVERVGEEHFELNKINKEQFLRTLSKSQANSPLALIPTLVQ